MRLGGTPPPADWLLVGLGNPGPRYERTRHNIGFMVLDELQRRWDLPRGKGPLQVASRRGPPPAPAARASSSLAADVHEPRRSGRLARARRYRVELDHVLALHDEIDLPFGDLRPRLGGGLAGHNGLKSLKAELGSPDFGRLRIGVSRPDSTTGDRLVLGARALHTSRRPRSRGSSATAPISSRPSSTAGASSEAGGRGGGDAAHGRSPPG